MKTVQNDSEVLSLASKIVVEIGKYAAKIRASGQASRRSFVTLNVTNLQRVIQRRKFPRMEVVHEGKTAWVVGPLPQVGAAKQLCVDPDGHGYIVNSSHTHDEPEPLTINTLVNRNPEQLKAIHELIVNAR